MVAVAMLVGLVSCGRTSDGGSLDARVRATLKRAAADARRDGYVEQAEALEDGTVTDAEYHKLFSLFRECAARHHVEIDPPMVSPIDGRRLIWLPSDGGVVEDASTYDAMTECQVRFIARVEASVVEDPRPMSEALRRAVARCLAPAGVRLSKSDDDIRKVMRAATSQHVNAVADCVTSAAHETFPGLKVVPFVSPVVF